MILEAAYLYVDPAQQTAFERAFRKASPLIASINGYRSHELQKCVETDGKYLLLVRWESLEAHTVGFRQSDVYTEWKALLHHFYDPFPVVKHFTKIDLEQETDEV